MVHSGENPIGRRILVGRPSQPPAEIVGIAADVHQNLENTGWPECVYLSFAQGAVSSSAMLAIRTEGEPLRFTGAVREQVRALDRDQPKALPRTRLPVRGARVLYG